MAERKSRKRKIINKRRLKVAEIWERDMAQTQEQIMAILADEFGIKVSQATVSRDLAHLDKCILAQSEAVVRSVKDALIDEYQTIYAEAMAAWLRSLEDKQTITNEAIEGGSGSSGERIKAQERTEGQSGNPALLAQAQAALKAIRELIGTDAATKHEHSGPAGGPISIAPVIDKALKKAYGTDSGDD